MAFLDTKRGWDLCFPAEYGTWIPCKTGPQRTPPPYCGECRHNTLLSGEAYLLSLSAKISKFLFGEIRATPALNMNRIKEKSYTFNYFKLKLYFI